MEAGKEFGFIQVFFPVQDSSHVSRVHLLIHLALLCFITMHT
jgi:hypothetical protein